MEVINKLDLLKSISLKKKQVILKNSEMRSYPKSMPIICQNSAYDGYLYLLLNGQVLVTKKWRAKTYELLKLQRLELFGTFEVERKD